MFQIRNHTKRSIFNKRIKEWTYLRNLINQRNIVIKETDQAGKVTVPIITKTHTKKVKKTIKETQKYFHR